MMTIAASDGLKLFIPQVYDIVWSLIILVIVALFFHKFFMPKFNAIFDERAAKIEGNIAKAEQSKKDADAAKSKYEAQLSTARGATGEQSAQAQREAQARRAAEQERNEAGQFQGPQGGIQSKSGMTGDSGEDWSTFWNGVGMPGLNV